MGMTWLRLLSSRAPGHIRVELLIARRHALGADLFDDIPVRRKSRRIPCPRRLRHRDGECADITRRERLTWYGGDFQQLAMWGDIRKNDRQSARDRLEHRVGQPFRPGSRDECIRGLQIRDDTAHVPDEAYARIVAG